MTGQRSRPLEALDDIRSNVREYARILRRRWRLVLLTLGLVGSAAFWGSQYLPRQYQATTIFERRDDVVLQNLISSKSPYSFSQLKASIARDMTGLRAMAEAAIALGLLPAEAIGSAEALSNEERHQVEAALEPYDLHATVQLVHSSSKLDTIELRCVANDPQMACRFAVALREGYIARTRARIAEILNSAKTFFAGEVERFERLAAETGTRLKEQFSDFPGVDPTDPSSLAARLEVLEAERARQAQRKAELDAQIAVRERFLASPVLSEPRAQSPPQPARPPPEQVALEHAIARLEQELTEALVIRRMTEEHPRVRALRQQLEALRVVRSAASSAAEPAAAPSPSTQPNAAEQLRRVDPVLASHRLRIELELESLRAQAEVAARHLEAAEARLAATEALYQRMLKTGDVLQQLQTELSEYKATASIWRQHLLQLERVLAAESEQRGTRFVLIEEPEASSRAVQPRVAAIFVVCLGAALAAALVLVALSELFDRSFRSVEQVVRSLGLPVLGCVGVVDTPRVRRRRLFARLIWTPVLSTAVVALLATASLAYVSLAQPDVHRRAIGLLDNFLVKLGGPPTHLADNGVNEAGLWAR